MPINADKPHQWKNDINQSVDFFNRWFLTFAPAVYRKTRIKTAESVEAVIEFTDNFTFISSEKIKSKPEILQTLRMATAPPIARDRLIGLATVERGFVNSIENKGRIPRHMSVREVELELGKILKIFRRIVDKDIITWLGRKRRPSKTEIDRASSIIADRLCGSMSDPIIRNAQERRQLASTKKWLEAREYKFIQSGTGLTYDSMKPGTFAFHLIVPIKQTGGTLINIPIDIVVKPRNAKSNDLPIMIEAKSAGDFTNVNKRRKEEATKMAQLRQTYGKHIQYILLLCGYFDSGYLGYEAAEGIDWIWEHRLNDLRKFGI
jgi:hypothetical protein